MADLLKYHGAGAVRHLGIHLHTTVDGAGMEDEGVRLDLFHPVTVESEEA